MNVPNGKGAWAFSAVVPSKQIVRCVFKKFPHLFFLYCFSESCTDSETCDR